MISKNFAHFEYETYLIEKTIYMVSIFEFYKDFLIPNSNPRSSAKPLKRPIPE